MIDANGNYIPDDPTQQAPVAPQDQGPGFFQRLGTGLSNAYDKITTQDPRYPPGVSPLLSGLAGMAGAYGQMAMPSRMPVPFGAVMGAGAQGLQSGLDSATQQMGMYQKAQGEQLANVARGYQNQVSKAQLPMQLSMAKMMNDIYSNPDTLKQLLNGGGPGMAPPQPPGVSGVIGPMSSAGGGAANGQGQNGNGLAAAFSSIPDPKLRPVVFNAAINAGMTPAEIPAWIATLHGESGFNNTVGKPNSNGTVDYGIGQVNSSHFGTPEFPNLNAKTALDPQINLAASASIFHKGYQGAGGDPIRATAAYNTGSPDGTPPSYAPDVARAVGGGDITSYAQQQVQKYEQLARTARLLPGGLGGDPGQWMKAADQWRDVLTAGPKAGAAKSAEQNVLMQTEPQLQGNIAAAKVPAAIQEAAGKAAVDEATAGPIALQKALNTSEIARPGSGGYIINDQGQRVPFKLPELKEVEDPATGQKNLVHVAPASVGAPPGTPGTADPVLLPGGQPAVGQIPVQQQQGRNEAVKDFLTKDQDSYQAAQNTQGWLNQIDHAASMMKSAGPAYQTGPFAAQRYQAMSSINDLSRSLGLKTPFDQKAVASWEEMKKATTTAGFELSSHYEGHARQAASTIQNATSAVPAVSNSPEGQALVSAGIREGAQSAIDVHAYKQSIYNQTKGAGLENAETDFYQKYPPTMYANRAISMASKPFPVSQPSDLEKYLPGTMVSLNGVTKMVPARPGAPPIPSYILQQGQ